MPIQAQPFGQLLQNPQVLFGFARWLDGLTAHLHQPVGVGKGAVFLGEGTGRQDHVGQVGGFSQKDVLHHEVIQRGKRLASMVGIGVGHGGVLAHHVHATDLACFDGIHDFNDGQAGLVIQRTCCYTPGFFESGAHRGVSHMLVVGVHHRDQTRIRRALHVVLATQRVQPGTWPADLASHQCQRNQAARVVGAVNVLRHTHAPQNHRGRGRGVQACDVADVFCVNTADGSHLLGAVAFDVGLEFSVPDGAACNEFLVDQVFMHDDVHHGVEQSHVGVGLELQKPVCCTGQV